MLTITENDYLKSLFLFKEHSGYHDYNDTMINDYFDFSHSTVFRNILIDQFKDYDVDQIDELINIININLMINKTLSLSEFKRYLNKINKSMNRGEHDDHDRSD